MFWRSMISVGSVLALTFVLGACEVMEEESEENNNSGADACENVTCPEGEECDKETGACIPMTRDHCAPCDAEAENQCGGDPNYCVTFQAEDPNTGETVDKGDFCILTCDEDPVDKCPSGYNCEKLEDQDGALVGYYCVRMCYYEPPPLDGGSGE